MSRLSLSLVPFPRKEAPPAGGGPLPAAVAASILCVAASAAGVLTRGEGGDEPPMSMG